MCGDGRENEGDCGDDGLIPLFVFVLLMLLQFIKNVVGKSTVQIQKLELSLVLAFNLTTYALYVQR